jgi:hypothetical protein
MRTDQHAQSCICKTYLMHRRSYVVTGIVFVPADASRLPPGLHTFDAYGLRLGFRGLLRHSHRTHRTHHYTFDILTHVNPFIFSPIIELKPHRVFLYRSHSSWKN